MRDTRKRREAGRARPHSDPRKGKEEANEMKRFSKRTWVVIGIVLAIALSAVGAFAYWTTTGSGNGNAAVAPSNGTVTLHGSAPTNLFPGGSSNVTFTADNAGASNLFVG